jgi:hypothetical protein
MHIKKMITVSIALLLTLAFAGYSFAADEYFTDLTGVPSKDKILAMQEKGYITGVGNHLFAPDEKVTAAQGVQFIVNCLDLNLDLVKFAKEPKATDYFVKADNNAWYANALIIASVNGLEFPADLDPNKLWTREEFTYQFISAAEKHANLPLINIVPVNIADQDQLSISYDGAIQRALVYGVVSLDDHGEFNPKDTISRVEAIDQIYNMLKYIEKHPMPVADGDK